MRKNTHNQGFQGGVYTKNREYRWMDIVNFYIERNNLFRSPVRILDVGCGNGQLARFFHEENEKLENPLVVEYYGIDLSAEYKKPVEQNKGKFINASYEEIPKLFRPNFFDIVVASEIIEHIDETDKFIVTLRNSLKKGGYLYLTTPNLASWHSRILLFFGYLPLSMEVSNIDCLLGKGIFGRLYSGDAPPLHHIRCFTHRAMVEFLRFHRLKIVLDRGGAYTRSTDLLFKFLPEISPVLKIICTK